MSVFVLSISAVETAFATFVTARTATAAARTAIVNAGARPTFPIEVVDQDTDWNDIVTSQNTWDATNTTLQTTLQNALHSQRTAELAVIETLGYLSGDSSGICLNQWVSVGDGVYIGAGFNSTYLTVISFEPTQAYPLY